MMKINRNNIVLRQIAVGEKTQLNLQDVKNVVIYNYSGTTFDVKENGNAIGIQLAANGTYVLFGVVGFGGLAPSILPNDNPINIQLDIENTGASDGTILVKSVY